MKFLLLFWHSFGFSVIFAFNCTSVSVIEFLQKNTLIGRVLIFDGGSGIVISRVGLLSKGFRSCVIHTGSYWCLVESMIGEG